MVGLTSPILNARKTKARLREHLIGIIEKPANDELVADTSIEGNEISVKLCRVAHERDRNCVFGYVMPNGLGYNTFDVTFDMFQRCLKLKISKCRHLFDKSRIWLALQSDYFFAEPYIVKMAADAIKMEIRFERILFVDRDGSVNTVR